MKISKSKVLLLSFFLFWIGVGYGTYWWYQFSLDRQALESLPYEGPLLDRVYELVVGPDKDLSKAEQKLAELAEYHRARILVELSSDNDAQFEVLLLNRWCLWRTIRWFALGWLIWRLPMRSPRTGALPKRCWRRRSYKALLKWK